MTWRVFYSYSHQDIELRNQLGKFLAPLRQNKKIEDWHDRNIGPGSNWQTEISQRLREAHLIVFLISPDFLNSEYCLGVEVQAAMERLKGEAVKIVPILARDCLWEESIFSQLQMVPRDAKPIISQHWRSNDEAFRDVANEIRAVVSSPLPVSYSLPECAGTEQPNSNFNLVKEQVRSYARLYERTRLRMRPSDERTVRMEDIATRLRNLALASYPLLDGFVKSPFPGERLAAITILQVFAAEEYLGYLVDLIGSEKPFIGYHAARALRFAVDSLEPASYPRLREALNDAVQRLQHASVGFDADRQKILREASDQLNRYVAALPVNFAPFD